MFTVISVLVLLVGCINFVVLATALAAKRTREVAMRKVMGAKWEQLIVQYLGESLLLTLVAFVIALFGVVFLLPLFESIVQKDLLLPFASVNTWLYLILLFVAVGMLGGLYPAIVLSNQLPIKAFRSHVLRGAGGFFNLRNVLVIFQFAD